VLFAHRDYCVEFYAVLIKCRNPSVEIFSWQEQHICQYSSGVWNIFSI